MTSPTMQPPTLKRRFQTVVRRSLSKIRHGPPPVPPKDSNMTSSPSASTHSRSMSRATSSTHQQDQIQIQNPSRPERPAIPPHYYHSYTQTECDGRHYEPSSPTSPNQSTSAYDYDAKRGQRCYGHDDAAQYDLTTPALSPSANGIRPPTTMSAGKGSGHGRNPSLSLDTKDHGAPLIPRQELMMLNNPPPPITTATTSMTTDSGIGLARSSSSSKGMKDDEQDDVEGFEAGPAYRASPFRLVKEEEEQQEGKEPEDFQAGPAYKKIPYKRIDEEGSKEEIEGFQAGPAYRKSPLKAVKENREVEEDQDRQEVEGFKAGPVYGQGYGYGQRSQPHCVASSFGLGRLSEEVGDESIGKGSDLSLRPAPKPPAQEQQEQEKPMLDLKRKVVPTPKAPIRKRIEDDQWERREGEHAWDFGEFHKVLDDDVSGDIGKAVSKDERDDGRTVSSSRYEEDEESAYHHVATPAEPTGHGKEKEEYRFPRTVPEDTVDGTVENAKAVVHETVQPEVHEVVQEQIHRDIHHYEEHYSIQPVLDVKVLPTRHIFIDSQGNVSELHFEDGKPPPGFEFSEKLRS